MSTPPGFNNPNIAGRKIATPRRRLNRASSDMGGQGAPMPNFTFQPPGGVAPSFGGGASGTSGTTQPSFSGFNRSASAGSAGFQFSAPSQATSSSQQQPFVFGSQTGGLQQQSSAPFQFGSGGSQPSSPSSFTFGTSAPAAAPTFGATAPTTTTSAPSFGSPTTTAAPSSQAQQPFKFGSPTTSPFGAGATASSTTATTSPFGSPSLTPATTGTAVPATTTTPSTPPSLTAFGSTLSSTSSTTTSPTASTFTFGSTAQQQTPASPKIAGGFTFGGNGAATSITATGDSTMATDTTLSQPFSIGSTTTTASPSATVKTPSFSFGSTTTPAAASTEKPATTEKSTTEKPAAAATTTADKSTFSFGSTSPKQGPSPFASTTTTTTTTPAMTTATTTSSAAASPFKFGATTTTTDKLASSTSSTTTKPAFSFGTPASTTTTSEKPPVAPKMPTFSFGSPSAGEKDGSSDSTTASKDEAPVTTGSKRKTLDTAAAESARNKLRHGNSPLSQSWNAEDEEQPATKRASTGLNDASNRLQSPSPATEDKSKDKGSSDVTSTTTATAAAPSSTESEGKKRPLEGADNTGTQAKKVTFSTGESSASASASSSSKKSPFVFGAKEQQDGDKKSTDKKKDEKESATTTTTTTTTTTKEGDKENKPVNPFKPLESTPIEIPSSSPSSSSTAPKSQSTSSDIFGKPTPTDAEQTMIESKITSPDGIEKRTRYRELPAAAQTELDNLWWFIDQQVRMAKEIETRQLASNGELIRDLSQSVHRMSKDLTLLKEQHHITAQSIASLTESTEYQVQNASVAKAYSDHQNQGRRMEGGTTIHRRYFFDLVKSLNDKCTEYRNAINDIEERMRELDQVVVQSPAGLADILRTQNETLIALAAQVADLHQQTEKLKA